MTALLIGRGRRGKKGQRRKQPNQQAAHRQPIINGWREVSPVWVNKPIDETKGEKRHHAERNRY